MTPRRLFFAIATILTAPQANAAQGRAEVVPHPRDASVDLVVIRGDAAKELFHLLARAREPASTVDGRYVAATGASCSESKALRYECSLLLNQDGVVDEVPTPAGIGVSN